MYVSAKKAQRQGRDAERGKLQTQCGTETETETGAVTERQGQSTAQQNDRKNLLTEKCSVTHQKEVEKQNRSKQSEKEGTQKGEFGRKVRNGFSYQPGVPWPSVP